MLSCDVQARSVHVRGYIKEIKTQRDMADTLTLPPLSEWTPESHTQRMREFFQRFLKIDNEIAIDNLIAAGYDRMACLDEAPPTRDDLDKLGFTMYQRNRLSKVFEYGATAMWICSK
jgi:hypothetical protein